MNRARMSWRAAMRLGGAVGLGAALASACSGAPGGGAAPAGTAARPRAAAQPHRDADRPRALSYLQDDYERIFPERVRLARYGEARYAASDLGDVGGGDRERSDAIEMGEAPALVVVDQVRDRVRVIAPQDHYRLLLWIDSGDLYTVATAPVGLAPDGAGAAGAGAADPAPAIRLRPGLPIEIDGERRGFAHIKHRGECVSFSGWIPRRAVGKQFVPVEAAVGQGSAMVSAGTVVHERPGGREVARFIADCQAIETGPESDGFRPIAYATESFELRGWVTTGSGKASGITSGGASWGYGLGHLGLWGARARFRLEERTCLHARRGGPAVGVVTDDTDAPLSPAVNGWRQVPIESGWGDLTVWVAEERSKESRAGRRPAHGPSARAGDSGVPDEDEIGDVVGGEEGDEAGAAKRPSLRRCR